VHVQVHLVDAHFTTGRERALTEREVEALREVHSVGDAALLAGGQHERLPIVNANPMAS